MAKQIYKQDEISDILKRAAEMQGSEGDKPISGLTLSELELIAEDSGIDPRYVKLAALEIEAGNESGMRNFWGGPLSCTIEREIDGEITDAIWERMVTEI